MPEPTPTPRNITLEELLRLKRHERPGPEFWVRFDRELNERVWRTLVQPAETAGSRAGFFGRRLRWLAAGMVSTAAVILGVWPGQPNQPEAAVRSAPIAVASNFVATTPEVLPEQEPVRVALAVSVKQPAEAPESDTQPLFAVAALESSPRSNAHEKIPATVAFAADSANGVHYAAQNLQNAELSARWRGSAY